MNYNYYPALMIGTYDPFLTSVTILCLGAKSPIFDADEKIASAICNFSVFTNDPIP